MMEITSSSYLRHLENSSLHAFRPLAMEDTSLILQSLAASLASVMLEDDQQLQPPSSSVLLLARHSVARVTKVPVAVAQVST